MKFVYMSMNTLKSNGFSYVIKLFNKLILLFIDTINVLLLVNKYNYITTYI